MKQLLKTKILLTMLLAASVVTGSDTLHVNTLCIDEYYQDQCIVVDEGGALVRCTLDNCTIINNGIVIYNTICYDEKPIEFEALNCNGYVNWHDYLFNEYSREETGFLDCIGGDSK